MKAIETHYNSYRFRSRLEARWAVFFNYLGIGFEYEKEGFDLDGTMYLPDFWLPRKKCWIEIKGECPSEDEKRKCLLLSKHTGHSCFLFHGNIPDPDNLWPDGDYDAAFAWVCKWIISQEDAARDQLAITVDKGYMWGQCDQCGCIDLQFEGRMDRSICRQYGACHLSNIDSEGRRYDSPLLRDAYTAARQARFEYGEQP